MASEENSVGQLGSALVFGGCGYLGCHIVEALLLDRSFASVVAASRNPTRWRAEGASYRSCDITDSRSVHCLLDEIKPRVVFHAVAPNSNADARAQYRINYAATKQLLEITRKHTTVQAFIYTSSARAIASESNDQKIPLVEEEAVLHHLSSKGAPYERTKGAADALTLAMNTRPNGGTADFCGILLTAVIRVPALYGRRDLRTSRRILERTNTRGTRIQLGNNQANHEWLYFDNAAHAHVLAAKALLDGRYNAPNARIDGEAFFITDGEPIKFWDFSRKLWAAAGDKSCLDTSKVTQIPMWLVLAVVIVGEWVLGIFTLGKVKISLSSYQLLYIDKGSWWSIEKARKRLGYEPLYGTDEGIRRTVEWFTENRA